MGKLLTVFAAKCKVTPLWWSRVFEVLWKPFACMPVSRALVNSWLDPDLKAS